MDATGDLTAFAYDDVINILRAQLVGAATLFPLPVPEEDETWLEAMQDNYRIMMDFSIMDVVIPIFKSGALVKDFRTQNENVQAWP